MTSISVAIGGIAVIGYAGGRSQNMTEAQKKAAVKDFALGKGLLVALLAGVMSACFSLVLASSEPIKLAALGLGTDALYVGLPAILLITYGGFITNAAYCLFQNVKNNTLKDYYSVSGSVLTNNILFCALAGVLWYSQFFGLALGKTFQTEGSVMLSFS